MGYITRNKIIEDLYTYELYDIANNIIALTDGDTPKPSNPETYVPPEKSTTLKMDDDVEKRPNKLFTSRVICNCSMDIEFEASDSDDAILLAPGVAYDFIIQDILPLLNEKFKSFNFKFNKFKPTNINQL